MVLRVVTSKNIFQWIGRSWRIYKKRPLYLWGGFFIFALVTVFPPYVSPFGSILSGFLLPLLIAGAFLFVFRIVRFKRATYDDFFYPFSDARLAFRILPISFLSCLLWTTLAALDFLQGQPHPYHLDANLVRVASVVGNTLNIIFLLGVTPILVFSSLNFIEAIALIFRSVRQNLIAFGIIWGGSALVYYWSLRWIPLFIPAGAFLLILWFVSFESFFMIRENPLRAVIWRKSKPKPQGFSLKAADEKSVDFQEEPVDEFERLGKDYYNERYEKFDLANEKAYDDDHTEEIIPRDQEVTQTKTRFKTQKF
ncbi:MAG: hypothetical protein KDD35_07350 [Bdellovibrionales bacterium]|nr:hypothetical protein [Bdellovibrionales bacterium]